MKNRLFKGPFKYYLIKKVGGWVRPNAYVCLQGGWVGGWVWLNAYIIIRITKKKGQIDLGERLQDFAICLRNEIHEKKYTWKQTKISYRNMV